MSGILLETLSLPGESVLWGGALLLKIAAVLAASWMAAWLFRHRSAAFRHGIWSLAVAFILVIPLLSSILPAWQVRVPEVLLLHRPEPSSLEATIEPRTDAAPAPLSSRSAYGQATPMKEGSGQSVPAEAGGAAMSAEPASLPSKSSGPLYVLIVWASGAAILLFLIAMHAVRIRLIARRAYSDVSSKPAHLLRKLIADHSVRRSVRLLYSDRFSMPVTWGVLRPVILLPQEAATWSEDRLRVVLLHELAHIQRFDYVSHVASEIACAFYWPNPFVWLARTRLQSEEEQACDDRVITAGVEPYTYAEHLVDIARTSQAPRWTLPAGTIAMARESKLKGRVRAILDGAADRHPASFGHYALLAALLTVLALPTTALHLDEPNPAADRAAGQDSVEVSTADAQSTVEDAQAGGAYIWMEAEEGEVRLPMARYSDISASHGRYLMVPNGSGNGDSGGGGGRAAFTFNVDAAGAYMVWGRVLASSGTDNSFYVSMDDGEETRWNIFDADGDSGFDHWIWLPVASSGGSGRDAAAVAYVLEPGPHTLQIRNREDGTRIDRVLVTDDDTFRPQGRGSTAADAKPVYLWTEAEDAVLRAPMHVVRDGAASRESYIGARKEATGGEGTATFTLDIPQAGPYILWGRVFAPDAVENSFFVSVDGREEFIWDTPGPGPSDVAEQWTWDPVSAREGDDVVDPVVFDLEAGRHTLHLRNRESGTGLDGIIVTDDLGYRPRGIRPLAPTDEPVYVWLEAEQPWRLQQPLEIAVDESASGGQLLSVPSKKQSRDEPPRGGRAAYRFDVPRAGTYTVLGRVSAPDGSSNSFWVRVNDGRWIKWNSLPEGDGWHWEHVHDTDAGGALVELDLSEGVHTLEIAYRESNVRLDRILVTNEPRDTPRGLEDDPSEAPSVEVVFR